MPEAGVLAKGAARVVAQALIAEARGEPSDARHLGQGTCYIEFGGGRIGSVDIDFLSDPTKTGTFNAPSADLMSEKVRFGSSPPGALVRALSDRWEGAVVVGRYTIRVNRSGIQTRESRREGEGQMAIGIYFADSKFPVDKYDAAISKLAAAGAGAPQGRTHHIALEMNGNINVFDIWESQAAFDAFGATLMPILGELGIDPGTPVPASVHNVIEG